MDESFVSFYFGLKMQQTITRTETIDFKMEFNHEEYLKHKNLLEKVLHRELTLKELDTLTFNYKINLAYLDNLEEALDVLLELAHNGMIVGGSYEELEHGRCMLLEIVNRIDKLNAFRNK